MKIAISGKGGVGKTTLSALLAQAYADQGRDVLAVDADPSPCLAGAIGVPTDLQDQLTPIAEMDDLILERTGAAPGTTGGFFAHPAQHQSAAQENERPPVSTRLAALPAR